MPAGQVHAMTGIMMQEAAEGKLWAALPLAIASHYALDDLNWGPVAIHHGLGKGWLKAGYIAFRAVIWIALGYLIWNDPILIIGALAAMSPDLEHIYRKLSKRKRGFHSPHDWLKDERGIWVWMVITALMLALIWR